MWLCYANLTFGQQVKLWLHPLDAKGQLIEDSTLLKAYKFNNTFSHSTDAYSFLKKQLQQWQEQGFVAASIDSAIVTDTALIAFVYKGNQFKWAKLNFDKIPKAILMASNINTLDWEQRNLSPRKYAQLNEQLLKYGEDNGYPFAYTNITDLQQRNEGGLTANYNLTLGKKVTIDTLIIESNIEIAVTFLHNYLGIKPGDLYNESLLKLISKRIRELNYLEEAKPWQMNFSIGKNSLKLFLKERKANQLNGLVGLQPNTNETGKFLLTADVLLGLKNVLGYGETIDATYQNLQYKSPRMIAKAAIPYLLGSPVGAEGGFELFKRDTTFYRTTFDIAAKYQLSANDYFKIGYQHIGNRIITADTAFVKARKQLPDNLDITAQGVLAEFYTDKTDFRLNPQRGWQAKIGATGLLRNIRPNNAIVGLTDGSGFNYQSLYDTINNNKYQYRITGGANYFISVVKNMVIKIGYNGGLISGSNLFLNELFQIGGFKLLRGFDEQSLFASHYHIGTAELRFILGTESYFYLFSDNAYIERNYIAGKYNNTPISFGGGITLQNKSGLFNIALGLGKLKNTAIQFNQTRVHFGYAAFF